MHFSSVLGQAFKVTAFKRTPGPGKRPTGQCHDRVAIYRVLLLRVRRRAQVRVPRVRIRVRKAQPAKNPPGAGLRHVTARQTLVQAGRGSGQRRRPDDRSVV